MNDPYKLKDGSIIVVIGGGPAGTSCSIKLKKEAIKAGIDIKIILYEGKDFDYLYNQCVGVLSPPFTLMLQQDLEIELPAKLIKREISGYRLHASLKSVHLTEEENHEPTYVVRRIEFDNFMLERAKTVGVEVVKARTTYAEFVKEKNIDEVRIFGERGYQRADIVIGAFGLDEAMLGVFEKTTPPATRYKRPKKYLRSYITKIFAGQNFVESRLDNVIHAFLPSKIPNIEFGAVTPKDNYIMINIAGRSVTSSDMDAFLQLKQVKELIPENTRFDDLDFFEGKFPTSPARNPFGDRFVFVGDATGWLRPFKGKGINTAFYTGIAAAKTIINCGISIEALKKYEAECDVLREDYYFGSLVRHFTCLASKLNLFDYVIEIAKRDDVIKHALFDSISGHDSYKNIIKSILSTTTLKTFKRSFGVVFRK